MKVKQLALTLALSLVFLLSACATPAVAHVSVSSSDQRLAGVWFDGSMGVAVGRVDLETGIRSKDGSPLLGPVSVAEGHVLVWNLELDYSRSFEVGQELPEWAALLFVPGEAEAHGIRFAAE